MMSFGVYEEPLIMASHGLAVRVARRRGSRQWRRVESISSRLETLAATLLVPRSFQTCSVESGPFTAGAEHCPPRASDDWFALHQAANPS